ncbi:MAG: hypothetical protein PHD21_08540 [Flavobacteriales bacterium]|nr:hypothetical protein [Flavobacteriales bacterium]
MKKLFLLLIMGTVSVMYSPLYAQEEETTDNSSECQTKESIYFEYFKAKNYKDAFPDWLYLYQNCKNINALHYLYGAKMLQSFIDDAPTGAKTEEYKKLLMEVYDARLKNYPDERPGYVKGQKAIDMMKYHIGKPEEVVALINDVIATSDARIPDGESIDAVVLDYYFQLAMSLYESKTYTISEMFDIYEEISDVLSTSHDALEIEYNNLTSDSTRQYTAQEAKRVRQLKGLLTNNEIVTGNMEARIQPIATCEMLTKVLTADFDANQNDKDWLRKSSTLLQNKECFTSPIYMKISEAYYKLDPTARAARGLAQMAYTKNNFAKAAEYFKAAAELSSTQADRARNSMNLANCYYKMGQKSNARAAAQSALAIDPKMGEAWLLIGHMYASSANECGSTEFEKRAVHYAAIEVFRRALSSSNQKVVDAARKSIASSSAMAPDRTMIFQQGMAGKSLHIGCWIGVNVTIPSL